MIILNDPQTKIYSGEILHNRFAYKFFRKNVNANGDIIAFRAPAKVEVEGMIDLEDVLQNDFIYSQDMMHFLFELPQLNSRFGAVAFQRLFNTKIADILSRDYLKAPIVMEGDDIMVHKEFVQKDVRQPVGKASVSIVHVKDGITLGHTGINNVAGDGAPSFAYSCNFNDELVMNFMTQVCDMFYSLTEDIFVATTKTI